MQAHSPQQELYYPEHRLHSLVPQLGSSGADVGQATQSVQARLTCQGLRLRLCIVCPMVELQQGRGCSVHLVRELLDEAWDQTRSEPLLRAIACRHPCVSNLRTSTLVMPWAVAALTFRAIQKALKGNELVASIRRST